MENFGRMLMDAGSILDKFSWLSILLHIVNLVILVGVLWLLLYKPVKKMIKKRQETLQKQLDDNAAEKADADALKEKYGALVNAQKQETAKASEEARVAAEQQKAHILSEAQQEADELIERAKQEVGKERRRAENEMKREAAELAADIAGKLIRREIKPKDNEKIIDECLKEWETK